MSTNDAFYIYVTNFSYPPNIFKNDICKFEFYELEENSYLIVDLLEYEQKDLMQWSYFERMNFLNSIKENLLNEIKIEIVEIYSYLQMNQLLINFPNHYFHIVNNVQGDYKMLYYNQSKKTGIIQKTSYGEEIYEIFDDMNFNYLGIAYISGIEISLFLYNEFKTKESVKLEIKYNEKFGKWQPILPELKF